MSYFDASKYFDEPRPIGDILKEMLYDLQNVIALNEDLREKSVGDIVIVWDGSSFTDMNGKEVYLTDFGDYMSKRYIVSEKGLEFVKESVLCHLLDDCVWTQDLVVIDLETNISYRVSSDHVKLANR